MNTDYQIKGQLNHDFQEVSVPRQGHRSEDLESPATGSSSDHDLAQGGQSKIVEENEDKELQWAYGGA
jgi:hypothetical protein